MSNSIWDLTSDSLYNARCSYLQLQCSGRQVKLGGFLGIVDCDPSPKSASSDSVGDPITRKYKKVMEVDP